MTADEDHRAARAAVRAGTLDGRRTRRAARRRGPRRAAAVRRRRPRPAGPARPGRADPDPAHRTSTPTRSSAAGATASAPAARTSFATYLNAFPASYWRRFTAVREVTLRVRTAGPGTLVVYRSSARGPSARVTAAGSTATATHHLALPLTSFVDGGWYWFDLVAGTDAAGPRHGRVVRARSRRPVRGRPRASPADHDRHHHLRPPGVVLGPARSSSAGPASCDDLVDEVLVIDQGTRRVTDDPGFDDAREALGGGCASSTQAEPRRVRRVLPSDDRDARRAALGPRPAARRRRRGRARGHRSGRRVRPARRRPTVVGGHMFSMHERSVLHAYAEVVRPWQFRWDRRRALHPRPRPGALEPCVHPVDAPPHPLRLHRLVDVPGADRRAARRRPVDALLHQVGRRRVRPARLAPLATPRSRCRGQRCGTCRGPTRTTASTGRRTSTPATDSWPPWCTPATSAVAGWSARAWRSRSSTSSPCSTRRLRCG